MPKPIRFNKDEVPLCPNDCGPMFMDSDEAMIEARFLVLASSSLIPSDLMPVLEARAHCLECRHTMIVADERIQPSDVFAKIPITSGRVTVWGVSEA